MTPERSSGPLQKLTASFAALACLSGAPACKDDAEKKAPDAEAVALTASKTNNSIKICLDPIPSKIPSFEDKTKFFNVKVTQDGVKFCVEFTISQRSSEPAKKKPKSEAEKNRQKTAVEAANKSADLIVAAEVKAWLKARETVLEQNKGKLTDAFKELVQKAFKKGNINEKFKNKLLAPSTKEEIRNILNKPKPKEKDDKPNPFFN